MIPLPFNKQRLSQLWPLPILDKDGVSPESSILFLEHFKKGGILNNFVEINVCGGPLVLYWNLLKVGLFLRYKGEKVTFLNSFT